LLGCGQLPDTIHSSVASCTPTPFYADADGDGWGAGPPSEACEAPEGFAHLLGDCDDGRADVRPNLVDDCDGRDSDCDGSIDEDANLYTWFGDGDGDGFGGPISIEMCTAPLGFVDNDLDCDDADADVWPGAAERCNRLDDDCDNQVPVDELDHDLDGASGCEGDCDDLDPARSPTAIEVCNGLDDDCDGALPADEADADLDGISTCNGDCDDTQSTVSPDLAEVVADGLDNDCDGTELCWLDADQDGAGGPTSVVSADLACTDATESDNTLDCNDSTALISGLLVETPYDGLDNDCDPLTSDMDVDGDGWTVDYDCNDNDPAINPAAYPAVTFTDVTVDAGLWLTHWDWIANPSECGTEIMAGGANIGDVDRDGDLDLFLPRMYETDRLMINLGDGTFVDAAASWGITHAGTSNGAAFFDLEGDGDLDLMVTSLGTEGNRLYVNQGYTFTEEAILRGVDMTPDPYICSLLWGVSAADVDGDGDIDLHLDQWHGAATIPGDRSRLFLNDGTGFFTDGTTASGIDLTLRAAFSSHFADVDDDGDLDLGLSADWGQSGLWINDGVGGFTETTTTAGVGTDENGMGGDMADFDGDGDLDWFVTSIYDPNVCLANWGCSGNRLYINDGTGHYSDGTDAAGVRDGAWGWGAAFFDYDNDGDLDLGHNNGFPDLQFVANEVRLFANDGSGVFVDRACETGLNVPGQGRAFLPFDYDNDGDLDVLMTLSDEPPRLYQNDGGSANAWLRVQVDEPGNPSGLGAVLWLTPDPGDSPIRRDIHANTNYVGTRPAEAHFGLSDHEADLFELKVVWPDGAETVVSPVTPRQILTVSR
jgi:hypothetical protein